MGPSTSAHDAKYAAGAWSKAVRSPRPPYNNTKCARWATARRFLALLGPQQSGEAREDGMVMPFDRRGSTTCEHVHVPHCLLNVTLDGHDCNDLYAVQPCVTCSPLCLKLETGAGQPKPQALNGSDRVVERHLEGAANVRKFDGCAHDARASIQPFQPWDARNDAAHILQSKSHSMSILVPT